jgi:hypothetical protein
MSYVSSDSRWQVDGVIRSTSPDLSLAGLTAGSHPWSLSYNDFLGRHYTYIGKITVLTPSESTMQNNILVINSALILDP